MREVIMLGSLDDSDSPGADSAAALGQLFDPFGLVDKVRELVSGETTTDPIPSPAPSGNPPTTAASTSYEVIASGLWIRAEPNGKIIGEAMRGEIVSFLGLTSGEWYLIRSAKGVQGWSSSRYLRASGAQQPIRYVDLDQPDPNVVTVDPTNPPPNVTRTADEGGGGGMAVALVLGVLAIGGGYYYFTQD